MKDKDFKELDKIGDRSCWACQWLSSELIHKSKKKKHGRKMKGDLYHEYLSQLWSL